MIISEEFKIRLIKEGIDPSTVANFTTANDKNKNIITRITLIDGTKHTWIDDFIWYASRKNKQW